MNSPMENFLKKPDFYTLGLGRLHQCYEILASLENELADSPHLEKLISAKNLLASAQTDLMIDPLDPSSHSALSDAVRDANLSTEEQSAIESAMGYASVETGRDIRKYLQDNDKAKSPVRSPTKRDEKKRKAHHRSKSTAVLLTGITGQRSPVRRRNSNIERLFSTNIANLSMALNITPKVSLILNKVDSWDQFDIFALDLETKGHALSMLCYHLLDRYNIFEKLKISRHQFANYLKEIEEGYNDVPYHNKVHAADVLHATHFFCQSPVLEKLCKKHPIIRLSAYFAAAIHDFKHPGTNNDYAKKTKHDLALIVFYGRDASFRHKLAYPSL